MREIGGYLELEDLVHNEYYPDFIPLNTARNALLYVCRVRKIKKLYLPIFLCDSVSEACEREGVDFEYYHIQSDFTPEFDKPVNEYEYLYIVNYYGQLSEKTTRNCKERYGNIIVDNVQAFFTAPVDDIDTIYSCRKFLGVPDGAYLYTLAEKLVLETDVSADRLTHLAGRYDVQKASLYYDDFKRNDMSFKELPLKYMSRLTHNLLGAIDYERIIRRRGENWDYLSKRLSDANKLKLTKPLGPYMYPFYCENGSELKKEMAKSGIYIPTLWPTKHIQNMSDTEKGFVNNILPLPVDQRYQSEDMELICEMIRK